MTTTTSFYNNADRLRNDPSAKVIADENLAFSRSIGYEPDYGWDEDCPYENAGNPKSAHHFLDHMYRLVKPDARTIYVAEPYGVRASDFAEFMRLADKGWHVYIGQYPLYFPGRCTQVCIVRMTIEEELEHEFSKPRAAS
jgi:hypothetical protein